MLLENNSTRQMTNEKSALFSLSSNMHLLLVLASGGLWLVPVVLGLLTRSLLERFSS